MRAADPVPVREETCRSLWPMLVGMWRVSVLVGVLLIVMVTIAVLVRERT